MYYHPAFRNATTRVGVEFIPPLVVIATQIAYYQGVQQTKHTFEGAILVGMPDIPHTHASGPIPGPSPTDKGVINR